MIHRSKTVHRDLNPVWDEDFFVHIDDILTPIQIKVNKLEIYCKI